MADLLLEIVEGPGAGRKAALSAPLTIGREPGSGLLLEDPQVSRRHARVTPADGGALAADLGSRNGTFVNHNQIYSPTRLAPGDQLLVGVTVLELRSAAQVAARPSAVRPVPPALATPPRTPDYVPPQVAKGRQIAPELEALLDVHTKAKAKVAPLAIFVLVVLVLLIFLALRGN